MADVQKRMQRSISVATGLTFGVVLSAFNLLASGRFNLPGFLLSVTVACVISLIINFLVPTQKIADIVVGNIKNKVVKAIISNLVISLCYSIILPVVIVFMNVGMGNANITKGIEGIEAQIAQISTSITEQERELKYLEEGTMEYIQLDADINELKGTVKKLNNQIDEMNAHRPPAKILLPRAIFTSIILSWVIGLAINPMYKKVASLHYHAEA